MEILTETYKDKISGVLGCYDRIVITGTIPQICYSQGMTSYLYSKGIRIFDYAHFGVTRTFGGGNDFFFYFYGMKIETVLQYLWITRTFGGR